MKVGAAAQADEAYRYDVRSSNWVGIAVADVLNLDLEKPNEKAKIKAVVKKWIETDVLRREEMPNPKQGRDVPCVVVGEWITREEAGQT